ncbi:BTB/POZ domain and ankyrin repeat-containing protein COCH isoform X2 [Physcomitrium patens]|uniref:BTB/POZ domain and ankyrin repeat-containing protein COCH isoform X2 n=1 Tax=Physcomitrium patens TaxID=3218 RepID=UPI000D16A6C9|nr:regulatory protein NPR5-like isoform X2 [Physcomitrium patens]|eukprot:XP_024376188.1 regulatory protein NPR5-like isoform X2 [Physcomitrella patens]
MQRSQQHSSHMAPGDTDSLRTLSLDFLSLLGEGQVFSDVAFEVEGRHVYAHSGSFQFSAQSSGRLCQDKSCWHTHCSAAVKFGLDILNAAVFFGVEQLSAITQNHLASMAEKASIEDVMRMLVIARKQNDLHLWHLCSKLVAKSGLSPKMLLKYLPGDLVQELQSIRQKTGYNSDTTASGSATLEQKIKRMQKALDSSDVELVKLMVMGEGLNLDEVFGLHYAVSSCSRKVVKNLLELGAANVNLQDLDGRTPLHIAAQLGDPEKIAMLLDHHAEPHTRTATCATAMDIVQSGAAEIQSAGRYNTKADHNRLRACMELLERAALASTRLTHTRSAAVVDTGSPASILTENGSSTWFPEESDNFQGSMSRMKSAGTPGLLQSGNDIFSSLWNGLPGKVHGTETTERGEASRSPISRLLQPNSEFEYFDTQQLQSESCSLTSKPTMLETSSLDERPREMSRVFVDLKDLPVLRDVREVVFKDIKDITNDALENFKRVYTPNDEEVNSGWQLFLQEHSEAAALRTP